MPFALTQLQRLDLSSNDLDDLSQVERLSDLIQLERLEFDGSESLPDLASLNNLQSFSAFGNRLRYIDATIFQENIEVVDLSHNQIEHIDGGFTTPSIYSLIWFNNLTELCPINQDDMTTLLQRNPDLRIFNSHLWQRFFRPHTNNVPFAEIEHIGFIGWIYQKQDDMKPMKKQSNGLHATMTLSTYQKTSLRFLR